MREVGRGRGEGSRFQPRGSAAERSHRHRATSGRETLEGRKSRGGKESRASVTHKLNIGRSRNRVKVHNESAYVGT